MKKPPGSQNRPAGRTFSQVSGCGIGWHVGIRVEFDQPGGMGVHRRCYGPFGACVKVWGTADERRFYPICLDGDLPTLHIRCGSDIRDTLRESGLAGDFLEYSDPVCQGPVPDVPDLAEWRSNLYRAPRDRR